MSKKWFGGSSRKPIVMQQAQMQLQQEANDSQKEAAQKQIEMLQNQQAAQELALGNVRKTRRGTRLLTAAETGFGGLGGSSKLG